MFFVRSRVLSVDFEGCIKVDVIGLAGHAWKKTEYCMRELEGEKRRRGRRGGVTVSEVQAEAGGGRATALQSPSCPLVFQTSLHTQPS